MQTIKLGLALNLLLSGSLYCAEPHPLSKKEREQASICFANFLWRELKSYCPDQYYDINLVMDTMKALYDQRSAPMETEECYRIATEICGKIMEEEAQKNLNLVEQYLKKVSVQPNIVEKQEEKLYYEILKPGSGSLITEQSTPLLHFKEYNLAGTVLRDTHQRAPLKLSLAETIAGFSRGVSGMRVGESRRIYVHPDLAYGKFEGQEPQQLLIFEVEILQDN